MWSRAGLLASRRGCILRAGLTRASPPRRSTSQGGVRTLQQRSGKTLRVGFVGLGNMGLPMALNLVKQQDASNSSEESVGEVSLLAYDTNPVACASLLDRGHGKVEMVASVVDLGAAGCDAVITMLPGCAAVDAVMGSIQEGLEQHSSKQTNNGSIAFIDCSTVSPTTSRRWHDIWVDKGHTMFDAPVSGGVKGATAGSLTFMVGCGTEAAAPASLDHLVRPLLELMGQRIVVCGGPGTGSATKLCNNLALSAQMVGICEALNLGEALNVDPVVLAEVMNTSTAACWSSQVNNPHPAVATEMKNSSGGDGGPPASRNYEGGFGAKLMLKDLGLAVSAAEESSVALPLTSTSKELYRLVTLRGLGDKDFGVMLEFLRGK